MATYEMSDRSMVGAVDEHSAAYADALTYDVRQDVAELRRDSLYILLWVSFVTWSILLWSRLIVGDFLDLAWSPAGTVVAVAGIGLAYLLRRRDRLEWACWTLVGALFAGPALLLFTDHSPAPYFLLIFPVVAASVLIGGTSAFQIAGAATIATLVGALQAQVGADVTTSLASLRGAIVPSICYFVVAGTVYLNNRNILAMVQWATDSQRKNEKRAEAFYALSEQLKQALLQVERANSDLAIVNYQLAEAQAKAERASNAKSIFLSNMSHELRTPLNVIIGYSSSMLDMPQMYSNTPLAEIYRSDIALMKETGYYLLGLINDILDLSKIEAGKLELHHEATHLPEIFRGVIATAVGLVKDKPLQIRPDFRDILPHVWADPMRVRQILLNLMSNAVKFTHMGSVTLQARVEGDFVRISVIDTGIGIPEKALPYIFDRFQQAQQDTEKRYGGTGLGLDISKQLTQMHGGTLAVHSQVDQGSTFSFTLPLATAQQIEGVTKPTRRTGAATIFAHTLSLDTNFATVMLVEDDNSLRMMLRRALESAGHLVVDTDDGANAVEMAVAALPDVILLDIQLPNLSGWEIIDELRANPETAHIPMLLCSGREEQERAAAHRLAGYLQKPITPEGVLAAVAEVLTTKGSPVGAQDVSQENC